MFGIMPSMWQVPKVSAGKSYHPIRGRERILIFYNLKVVERSKDLQDQRLHKLRFLVSNEGV